MAKLYNPSRCHLEMSNQRNHHQKGGTTQRSSWSSMIFPGRSHRNSSAAAEKDRATREDANRHSWLLKLPAELRNYVYELAVPQGRHVGICATRDFIEQCPLLGVCRQLQAEVMPMFFGGNTFMIPLRSLAKRSHHWRKRTHPSFTEDAFASLSRFELVNNYLCRVGRQRLPHCLHLDGVVVKVDRQMEEVVACQPIASSGIKLPGNSAPRPFASSDESPCFAACCLKSRKDAEERLLKEIKSTCLHFRSRTLSRQDVVDVGESSQCESVLIETSFTRLPYSI